VPTFTAPDGLELTYDVTGEGPPVVLHHGFAADADANWVRPGIVDVLVGSGRTVVALDARGHGRSAAPHDPQAYRGPAMARDVSALLDHLGIGSVDVVGYSMGGLVTSLLLADEPRLRSAVLGGVGARLILRTGGPPRPAAAIAAALAADDPSTITGAVPKAFRAFADSTGADRLALAAIQRAGLAPAPDLSQVAVPVLVIAGDRDDLVGDPSVLAAAIPGARHVVVSGDHLSAVYDPRFAAEVVAFLDEVRASA
jgi:pimeloyl-ACP methyl ester carboxylesterase